MTMTDQHTRQRPLPRRPSTLRSIIMFLSVIGPGIITANADNDVGGITVYSLTGAQFGYSMLWLLIPLTVALVVVQEMCARMGAVTGKGLADLIRENFGIRIAFWVLLVFVLGDLGNTASEFAGIASVAPIFQTSVHWLSKYALVPLAAVFVFTVVTRGNYRSLEKVLFLFGFMYRSLVISGFLVKPDGHPGISQLVLPPYTPPKAYLLPGRAADRTRGRPALGRWRGDTFRPLGQTRPRPPLCDGGRPADLGASRLWPRGWLLRATIVSLPLRRDSPGHGPLVQH